MPKRKADSSRGLAKGAARPSSIISYSIEDVALQIRLGKMPILIGLKRITRIACKQPGLFLGIYCKAVVEILPKVKWNPDGEYVSWGPTDDDPVTWGSASDFYYWANRWLGGVFDIGDFIKKYDAADKSRRESMIKDLENGKTQAQVAAERGISQQRVSQVTTQGCKARPLVSLYAGTSPEAAAARIRERLGDAFADALKRAL